MEGTHALRSVVFSDSWRAAADLSGKQFYFVKADTNGKIAAITTVEDPVIGVLDNDPTANRAGRVIHLGIAKVVSDGSGTAITRLMKVETDSIGRAVKSNSNRAVGVALTPSSAAGTLISVLLMLHPFNQQDEHLYINSDPTAKKQVRIGSEVSTQTGDTHMGFSSKPDLEGDGSATCTGAEISPRISGGGSGANLYGLNVNPLIKSDASAAVLSSEFCGVIIKMECASALVTTISGNVSCLRCEPSLSGNQTVSGKYVPLIIRDATQQGVGKNWDAVFMVGGDGGAAKSTGTPSGSQAGQIKVIVGSTTHYIKLYPTSG